MTLEHKDLELIERLIYKNADDIAVSIARSFERLEERIDGSESRMSTRIAEIDDRIETNRQDISEMIAEIRDEMREHMRTRDI